MLSWPDLSPQAEIHEACLAGVAEPGRVPPAQLALTKARGGIRHKWPFLLREMDFKEVLLWPGAWNSSFILLHKPSPHGRDIQDQGSTRFWALARLVLRRVPSLAWIGWALGSLILECLDQGWWSQVQAADWGWNLGKGWGWSFWSLSRVRLWAQGNWSWHILVRCSITESEPDLSKMRIQKG